MDIDARAFGQLEGEVKALREMMYEQNRVLKGQNQVMEETRAEISEIRNTLSEARGGWKTIVWLGGVSAALSAGLVWIIQHVNPKGLL